MPEVKLDELVRWYKALTPDTVPAVSEIYHEEARFRDPFNDVRGHEAIAAIFLHMFETTQDPVFDIVTVQKEGSTVWVTWVFYFGLRGRAVSIDGATRLQFGADGRVIDHRDYWDAADLYAELPMLRQLMRFLKKKLSARSRIDQEKTEE